MTLSREPSTINLLADLYTLAFVINQSLIAFDWVMSFEYPWISTLLFGFSLLWAGQFFILDSPLNERTACGSHLPAAGYFCAGGAERGTWDGDYRLRIKVPLLSS